MNPLLPNRTLQIPGTSLTYAYIHYAPISTRRPTVLLIHGFPATSHDWHHQIRHFRACGYGVIAPDCLGYGGTSKPLDVQPYIGRSMARDIIAILDHEGIDQVIGIAHDWGTYLLSQLLIWYPSRFAKAVFMSVPFSPPGRELDVRKINEVTKRKMGFEQYGYQIFLASEGAGKIIGKHWESFFSLVFPADSNLWKTHFAPVQGLQSQLEQNVIVPTAPYVSEVDKRHHHASFGDDFEAPCKWYVRGLENLGIEEEKIALREGKIKSGLGIETLMIGGLKDVVCPADRARASMEGSVEKGKLTVTNVDAGHWIMLEKVAETNKILTEFIERQVPSKAVL